MLTVRIYSHMNRWLPEEVLLIHTVVNTKRLVSYEDEPRAAPQTTTQ